MFIRPSAILLSIAALAVAAPSALEVRQNECNTGSLQCCNSVQSTSSTTITQLLGWLGIPVSSVTGQVGLSCSPITGAGTGVGSTCTQQPVCCNGNTFNGLLSIGCSPITVNA